MLRVPEFWKKAARVLVPERPMLPQSGVANVPPEIEAHFEPLKSRYMMTKASLPANKM